MINIQIPKNLTLEEVIDLRKTYWRIYDENSKIKPIFNKDIKGFNDIIFSKEIGIPKGTNPKDIGIILEQWYETLTQTPEYQGSETEAPEYKEQTQTTLSEAELKNLQEEQFIHETKSKESTEKSNKEVREALKRKEEIYKEKQKEEQIKNTKKVVVIPTEKIHTVTLSEAEKEKLYNLKQAVNNDPATVQKAIEEKIAQSVKLNSDPKVKNSVTPEIITKTAYSITQNIEALPNYKSISEIPTVIPVIHPSSPFVAMSNVNDGILGKLIPDSEIRKEVVDNAQTIAIALDTERSVNVAGANAALGSENITSIFYGDDNITQFQVSERQDEEREEGIEIDPEGIYRQGKLIKGVWKKIANETITREEISGFTSTFITPYTPARNTLLAAKSSSLVLKALPIVGAVYGYKQGTLVSHWATRGMPIYKLLGSGNQAILKTITSGPINKVLSSSFFIMSYPKQLVVGKFMVGFSTGITTNGYQVAYAGVRFGEKYAGILGVKRGTQALIFKSSTTAGSKLLIGASKLATKALTLLGGLGAWATAGLSLVATWLLGKVIEKIDWKKLKENFLPIVAIGAGILIGGPIGLGLIAAGGVAAIGAITGGAAGIAGGVGAIGGFLSGIGAAIGGLVLSIATPIIIGILIIPPTAAFYMFIINSGAYIVPPGSSTFSNIIDPYIEVTKTPVPPGPFNNSELPLTVEYKITVRAKKGILENIKLTYDCGVVREGSKINCPVTDPSVPTTLEDILPGETYEFSYSQTYAKGTFEDSLIVDTITATADTAGQTGIKSSDSAGVKIGNPPDSCPSIWPVDAGTITQTPGGGYSHIGVEAIDVGINTGTKVKATHSGVATIYETAGGYGRHVMITSNCGGKLITTIYGHLIGFSISNGDILLGQTIGASGSTGFSTGPHLHYEFLGGIKMTTPFIPRTVVRGCSGYCGMIP